MSSVATQRQPGIRRNVPVRDAGRTVKHLSIAANAQECAGLAVWLDVPGVKSLNAEIDLRLWQRDGLAIEGSGTATVTLLCGVTGEAFDEVLTLSFLRHYAAAAPHPARAEIDLSPDDSDSDAEELPQGSIDLGAILAEELSLAVPAWPRKPDAVFATGEEAAKPVAAEEPKKPNPFNALKDLTGKKPGASKT